MIKRVKIRNFKGIHKLNFDLPNPLVLFGINNSGKTTLLQALSVWSEIATIWRRDYPDLARNDDGTYRSVYLTPSEIFSVSTLEFNDLWHGTFVEKPIAIELKTESWKIEFEVVFGESKLIKVRPSKSTKENDLSEYIENPLVLTYISPHSGIDVIERPYDPNTEVIQSFLLRGQPGKILRNLLLAVFKNNSWELLQSKIKEYYDCELLQPSAADSIYLPYRELNQTTPYDLYCAGSGFLQMLMIFGAVLYRKKNIVILIDEPDAHLHPSLQQKILPDLIETFSDTQFIACTHSPQVVSTVKPEKILEVSREGNRVVVSKIHELAASYGAMSGYVLSAIMDVNERPDSNEFVKTLNEYMKLIGRDQGETEKARVLRHKLDELSPNDPDLNKADIDIRRRKIIESNIGRQ